jgi:hypothetical protein
MGRRRRRSDVNLATCALQVLVRPPKEDLCKSLFTDVGRLVLKGHVATMCVLGLALTGASMAPAAKPPQTVTPVTELVSIN